MISEKTDWSWLKKRFFFKFKNWFGIEIVLNLIKVLKIQNVAIKNQPKSQGMKSLNLEGDERTQMMFDLANKKGKRFERAIKTNDIEKCLQWKFLK